MRCLAASRLLWTGLAATAALFSATLGGAVGVLVRKLRGN